MPGGAEQLCSHTAISVGFAPENLIQPPDKFVLKPDLKYEPISG